MSYSRSKAKASYGLSTYSNSSDLFDEMMETSSNSDLKITLARKLTGSIPSKGTIYHKPAVFYNYSYHNGYVHLVD